GLVVLGVAVGVPGSEQHRADRHETGQGGAEQHQIGQLAAGILAPRVLPGVLGVQAPDPDPHPAAERQRQRVPADQGRDSTGPEHAGQHAGADADAGGDDELRAGCRSFVAQFRAAVRLGRLISLRFHGTSLPGSRPSYLEARRDWLPAPTLMARGKWLRPLTASCVRVFHHRYRRRLLPHPTMLVSRMSGGIVPKPTTLHRARTAALALATASASLFAAYTGAPPAAAASSACPWVGSTAPIPQRVSQLLAQMTTAQEVTLLTGASGSSYVGFTPAIGSLCIPAVNLEDG